MTSLYSCRHSGDQFRITKFDEHMNVESSYLCTTSECDCPAGHRRMCRHREMLPRFIQRGNVNSSWMFDYDRGGWVHGPEQYEPVGGQDMGHGSWVMPALPDGVEIVGLDDPVVLHNAIAEAVGEPEVMIVPKPKSWRRF